MKSLYRIILILIGVFSFLQHNMAQADSTDYPAGKIITKLYKAKPLLIGGDTLMVRPRWFLPDHYKLQYAGNIGFLALGAGYNIRGRYEPTLMVGLLNYTFGNSNVTVTTIAIKNSFNMFKKQLPDNISLRSGISVNWGHTHNTFNKLPAHYSDKYYFQNKIHLAPFVGGEYKIKFRDKNLKAGGLYFEFSTLDAYLLECVRTKYVKFGDIVNLALGITIYIK